MRLWELNAICRDKPSAITAELRDPRWAEIADDYNRLDLAIAEQDRRLLDQILPAALVEPVLHNHGGVVFCDGRQFRSYRIHADDEEVSFVEVYRRYGGNALEDILEKGSLSIEWAKKMNAQIGRLIKKGNHTGPSYSDPL